MLELFKVIESLAHSDPQREALLGSSKNITYAELQHKISVLSEQLRTYDFKRLGLFMPNCFDWVLFDLAAAKAGISVVPIPMFFSESQAEHIISDSQLNAVVTQQNYFCDFFLKAMPSYESFDVSESQLTVFSGVKSQHNKMSKITYTSGSTGKPKGVCLSEDVVMNTVKALSKALHVSNLHRHLCMIPFSTLLENVAGIYVPLFMGRSLVVDELSNIGGGFDVKSFCDVVESTKAESLILMPHMLKVLVEEADLEKLKVLKFIAVGGGKVPVDLLVKAKNKSLPVFEGYGLSECCSVVSLNVEGSNVLGSVGKPLEHVDVKISDKGEIIVRDSAMLGYLHQQTIERNYIKTGDVGYFDENGYLFISGRIKNLIVSSFGRNISPEWVESYFLAEQPIYQIAVFGEAQPYLSAVVVLSKNFSQEQFFQCIEDVNKHLPDYARVKHLVLGTEPFSVNNGCLTDNGKLCREKIERQYLGSAYLREVAV